LPEIIRQRSHRFFRRSIVGISVPPDLYFLSVTLSIGLRAITIGQSFLTFLRDFASGWNS
jgi:hypothetical protein